MSANYFGDLIKKMTGDTASNYIRQDLIQRVKNELASGASISQVAYELGFEYPQHLSRMFKKFCGYTPTDYLRQIQKSPAADCFSNRAFPSLCDTTPLITSGTSGRSA